MGRVVKTFAMRWTWVTVLTAVALAATAVVVAPGTAAPPTRPSPPVIVLVSGCDGLVAQGGVLPDPQYMPSPTGMYNHNFVLSDAKERWETTGGITTLRTWGGGADDAGHKFHVEADGMNGISDVFGGGTATVRRNDGSYARGGAMRLTYGPMSPLWTTYDGLEIDATECHVK